MRALIQFIALACGAFAQPTAHAPIEPPHTSGQGVTPAFEGWYANPDGSANILVGYYNRNLKQALDIPIGPNNRIEPGGPDLGQPTHFDPGRQWGVFTMTVPKGFAPEKKITWTIIANGKTAAIPLSLNPLWNISPFSDATGNTPPFIGFQESGPFLQGPPRGLGNAVSVTTHDALPLIVWVSDDAKVPPAFASFAGMIPAVTVTWSKFRGPGAVKFAAGKPKVEKAVFKAPPSSSYSGKASTTATFSEPGEYVLEVVANDISGTGGGGFQCCWTTAQLKVVAKP